MNYIDVVQTAVNGY